MKTVIRDQESAWRKVVSGVAQGSVLAPIIFTVHINDGTEGIKNYMILFENDAKLMKNKNRRSESFTERF